MDHGDIAAMMKGMAPVVRDYVAKTMAPANDRLALVESRLSSFPEPVDIDIKAAVAAEAKPLIVELRRQWEGELERIVAESRAMAAEANATISQLKAENAELRSEMRRFADEQISRSVDAWTKIEAAVPELLDTRVAAAVSAIRVPQDGKDGENGKDADIEIVVELAAKRVSEQLTEAIRRDVESIQADVGAISNGLEQKIADYVVQLRQSPEELTRLIEGHVAEKVAGTLATVARLEETVKSFRVPEDGHTPGFDDLAPLVEDAVQRRWETLRVPEDGVPGTPGKSVTLDDVAPVIREAVEAEVVRMREGMEAELLEISESAKFQLNAAIDALPAPKDGEPGAPGLDGKDAEPITSEQVIEAVLALPDALYAAAEKYLTDNPPSSGRDGRDGIDGKDAPALTVEQLTEAIMPEMLDEAVGRCLVANPPQAGKDGRDGIDGKDAEPITAEQLVEAIYTNPELLEETVVRYLTAYPPKDGKDGERGERGLAGEPGRDGRDGLPGVPGAQGEKGIDGIGKDGRDGVDGKDGKDGISLLDLKGTRYDHDIRTLFIPTKRGDEIEEWPVKLLGLPVYREVYQDGRKYEFGDEVTSGGSNWYARCDTAEKPGISKDWVLKTKKGRDGKDGVVRGPQGSVKLS